MKFICRREVDEYRFNRLRKGPNIMVSVYSKLYPVCNDVLAKDRKSEDAIAWYNSDETQPLLPEAVHIDTDKLIL